MENIRQKVVSVLVLLGAIIFFSRCSGDEGKQVEHEVVKHEVAGEEVEHQSHVKVSHEEETGEHKGTNPKTLFVRSDEDRAEAERVAELRA